MVTAIARQHLAALRNPSRTARVAVALWVAWAVVVWNVVFDHVIVVAGRDYLNAAGIAAAGSGAYARIDDWMRPAVTRALWTATAAGAAILVIGLVSVRLAGARHRAPHPQVTP
jgi:hypothetical protein